MRIPSSQALTISPGGGVRLAQPGDEPRQSTMQGFQLCSSNGMLQSMAAETSLACSRRALPFGVGSTSTLRSS